MFDKYNNNTTIKLNYCSNQAGYTPLLGMRGGVCCLMNIVVLAMLYLYIFCKIINFVKNSFIMGNLTRNRKLKKDFVNTKSEEKGMSEKIEFTLVSKSELEKRRIPVYKFLL